MATCASDSSIQSTFEIGAKEVMNAVNALNYIFDLSKNARSQVWTDGIIPSASLVIHCGAILPC